MNVYSIYTYVYVCMHACMYQCILYVSNCVHIIYYIYMYTYTYTYTYIRFNLCMHVLGRTPTRNRRTNPVAVQPGHLSSRAAASIVANFGTRIAHEMSNNAWRRPCEKSTNFSGWWYTYPSEKYEFVSWDDYSQYMENKIHVPNYQPEFLRTFWSSANQIFWDARGCVLAWQCPKIAAWISQDVFFMKRSQAGFKGAGLSHMETEPQISVPRHRNVRRDIPVRICEVQMWDDHVQ